MVKAKSRKKPLDNRLKSRIREIDRLIKKLKGPSEIYLKGALEDLRHSLSKILIRSKQLEKRLKKLKGEK